MSSAQEKLLRFSPGKGNAKLEKLKGIVYTFSLPSGWTCPSAKDCHSKAVLKDGKYTIQDGKETQFRCFSATQEVVYKAVREQRQYNFDLLRQHKRAVDMMDLISRSLPTNATIIRIHVGGDFFNKEYMRAWIAVAMMAKHITFYAYTKSVNYWVELKAELGNKWPSNLKLNASKGGKHDDLIEKHKLKYAEVVYSEKEAKDKGLEIDHDDTHAFLQDKPFALLLHGVQPKGSLASEALKKLKGKGSYGRPKKSKPNRVRREPVY